MDEGQAQRKTPRKNVPLRHVMAVFIGNGLEFYDFLTFSFFAVYIAKTFYPGGSTSSGLLATLATFGAGFLTRPIGAIVIGRMGDRVGRKPAMLLSFALMGFAIVGLALTPSYAQIGIAAPVLVIVFRLIQGFALGGEVGPTTAFMAEAAPSHRRGLYLSMQYATQDAAILVAGLVGTTLAALLTAQQLQDWGWRLALLLGAVIVPFGIMLRKTLPETLGEHHVEDDPVVLPASKRPYLKIIVLGLMMLTAGTIGSYTLNYLTTYALDTLHLPATISFSLIILNGGLAMGFEALGGFLSDKFGRKPVMILPSILLVVAIFPCFWVIDHVRSLGALYAAEAVMVILASLSSVPVIVTITETLPPRIRSGAVAMIYAFAISIFGGSTQFVIKLLLDQTGNHLAPAYYWTGAAVLGLIAKLLVTESSPVRRARPKPAADGLSVQQTI